MWIYTYPFWIMIHTYIRLCATHVLDDNRHCTDPPRQVFQICSPTDRGVLEVDKTYLLFGGSSASCSCSIRKDATQQVIVGNINCFQISCSSQRYCLSHKELWISYNKECSKRDKCGLTTLRVRDTGSKVPVSITCGVPKMKKVSNSVGASKDDFCRRPSVPTTVNLECFPNYVPPLYFDNNGKYLGTDYQTLRGDKEIFDLQYQGPYKLLEAYQPAYKGSNNCGCTLSLSSSVILRLYPDDNCVSVQCNQSACKQSHDTGGTVFIVKGPAEVAVKYTFLSNCQGCKITYFLAEVGTRGLVTYRCGSDGLVEISRKGHKRVQRNAAWPPPRRQYSTRNRKPSRGSQPKRGRYPPRRGGGKPPSRGSQPMRGPHPPRRGGGKPPSRGSQPMRGPHPPRRGGGKPPSRGSQPMRGPHPPRRGGGKPPSRGSQPMRGPPPPRRGGGKPPSRGSQPMRGPPPPRRGGGKPPSRGSQSMRGRYPPLRGGGKPSSQGSQPMRGPHPPRRGGGKPPSRGSQSMRGRYPPLRGGGKPSSRGSQSMRGRYPPLRGGGKPSSQGSQPMRGPHPPRRGGGKPPSRGSQPMRGRYPPRKGDGKPSSRGSQPMRGPHPPRRGGGKPPSRGSQPKKSTTTLRQPASKSTTTPAPRTPSTPRTKPRAVTTKPPIVVTTTKPVPDVPVPPLQVIQACSSADIVTVQRNKTYVLVAERSQSCSCLINKGRQHKVIIGNKRCFQTVCTFGTCSEERIVWVEYKRQCGRKNRCGYTTIRFEGEMFVYYQGEREDILLMCGVKANEEKRSPAVFPSREFCVRDVISRKVELRCYRKLQPPLQYDSKASNIKSVKESSSTPSKGVLVITQQGPYKLLDPYHDSFKEAKRCGCLLTISARVRIEVYRQGPCVIVHCAKTACRISHNSSTDAYAIQGPADIGVKYNNFLKCTRRRMTYFIAMVGTDGSVSYKCGQGSAVRAVPTIGPLAAVQKLTRRLQRITTPAQLARKLVPQSSLKILSSTSSLHATFGMIKQQTSVKQTAAPTFLRMSKQGPAISQGSRPTSLLYTSLSHQVTSAQKIAEPIVPWQVFQACSMADRVTIQLDKTYLIIASEGPYCSCLIRKSPQHRLVFSNTKCFSLGCRARRQCSDEPIVRLKYETICIARSPCLTTMLRIEAGQAAPNQEVSITCGVSASQMNIGPDKESLQDFCTREPTSKEVPLKCYPDQAPPLLFDENANFVGNLYTAEIDPSQNVYKLSYQGPYKLLEPYQEYYATSTRCGCILTIPKEITVEIYPQGDCVSVYCTTSNCLLSHDVSKQSYVSKGPAEIGVKYNPANICHKYKITYFLAEVAAIGTITYTCGGSTTEEVIPVFALTTNEGLTTNEQTTTPPRPVRDVPPLQKFELCSKADRANVELGKTYVVTGIKGNVLCSCAIRKPKHQEVIIGNYDCFKLDCKKNCATEKILWLRYKRDCPTKCSHTTLLFPGEGHPPSELSVICGTKLWAKRKPPADNEGWMFCSTPGPSHFVQVVCYPDEIMPQQLDLTVPHPAAKKTTKKQTFSIPFQGPYRLLPPYISDYQPSDNCGCTMEIRGDITVEVYSQGDCVSVHCGNFPCLLSYNASDEVYTIQGPADVVAKYNFEKSCANSEITFFQVMVNHKGSVAYSCGPNSILEAVPAAVPTSSWTTELMTTVQPEGFVPPPQVFQACSPADQSRLQLNKTYLLVTKPSISCYCLIRKAPHHEVLADNRLCFLPTCHKEDCPTKHWLGYEQSCSKEKKKCAFTSFRVTNGRNTGSLTDSDLAAEISITCGATNKISKDFEDFNSIRTKDVSSIALLQCYPNRDPPIIYRQRRRFSSEVFKFSVYYQGPYKLLDPYNVSYNASALWGCEVSVSKDAVIEVYPEGDCIEVSCQRHGVCHIAYNKTKNVYVVKGKSHIIVKYIKSESCTNGWTTYFLARAGYDGNVSYTCTQRKGFSPSWEMFQACSRADSAKLKVNTTYLMMSSRSASCSCLIRKTPYHEVVLGDYKCYKRHCGALDCQDYVWVRMDTDCESGCRVTTFRVEGGPIPPGTNYTEDDITITCGIPSLATREFTGGYSCLNRLVATTAQVQCFPDRRPPVEYYVEKPAEYVKMMYTVTYQGPYRLLEPYVLGTNISDTCRCTLKVAKHIQIEVHLGCKCALVECVSATQCNMLYNANTAVYFVDGPSEISVRYRDDNTSQPCDYCDETYFMASVYTRGHSGSVTYICGTPAILARPRKPTTAFNWKVLVTTPTPTEAPPPMPPAQVFHTCSGADRLLLEVDKTYLLIASNNTWCTCYFGLTPDVEVQFGNHDCFELICKKGSRCHTRSASWIKYKDSCARNAECGNTTFRVIATKRSESNEFMGTIMLSCGVAAFDIKMAVDFWHTFAEQCDREVNHRRVFTQCFPNQSLPVSYDGNAPLDTELANLTYQSGNLTYQSENLTYRVEYQGPYKLLEPYPPGHDYSDMCRCVLEVSIGLAVEIYPQCNCTIVRCLNLTLCDVSYNVTSDVYTIHGPGQIEVSYGNSSDKCGRCLPTYFIVPAGQEGTVHYYCGTSRSFWAESTTLLEIITNATTTTTWPPVPHVVTSTPYTPPPFLFTSREKTTRTRPTIPSFLYLTGRPFMSTTAKGTNKKIDSFTVPPLAKSKGKLSPFVIIVFAIALLVVLYICLKPRKKSSSNQDSESERTYLKSKSKKRDGSRGKGYKKKSKYSGSKYSKHD